MQFRKNLIIAIIALASSIASASCRASEADAVSKKGVEPFYKTDGLALKGFDPVAYFTEGKPVEGLARFEAEWNGAKWNFATEQNREMFTREPEKYAPQYGGYCAWAVGHGYTAKGDPEAWKIVDGKLYLNYNRDVKKRWEEDIPGYISKGDENWPAFLSTKPEHKGEGSN